MKKVQYYTLKKKNTNADRDEEGKKLKGGYINVKGQFVRINSIQIREVTISTLFQNLLSQLNKEKIVQLHIQPFKF